MMRLLLLLRVILLCGIRDGDYIIKEWTKAGLPKPSLIRMKFASNPNSIIIKKLGELVEPDIIDFQKHFTFFFK